MPDLTTAQQEALAKGHAKRRWFIWVEARDPDSGDPDPVGFWNDLHAIDYLAKTYHGSGNVIDISSVSARGDLTVPGITVTLSGVAPEALALVRGESIDQAPISVDIGIYDVETNALLEPLVPYFDGFIDDCQIDTPEAGGQSTMTLTCESTSRALTIERTATRSDASCKTRDANDDFYEYTGLQREKPLYFGRAAPT
jgi:hypothetical protein